jgi:hypothetical protein
MVWATITWQTSTMVPTVLRDTGAHLWHTCPSRHLKVQSSEDTCEVACAAHKDGEFERQPSLPGLLQDTVSAHFVRLYEKHTVASRQHILTCSCSPSLLGCCVCSMLKAWCVVFLKKLVRNRKKLKITSKRWGLPFSIKNWNSIFNWNDPSHFNYFSITFQLSLIVAIQINWILIEK